MVSGAISLLGPGEEALACFPALTNSFRAPAVVLFWKGGMNHQTVSNVDCISVEPKLILVRTSGSDSNLLHQRPIVDRSSPKLGDRRSPRAAKRDAQEELGKNKKEPVIPESEDGQDPTAPPPPPPPQVQENSHGNDSSVTDTSNENPGETVVFEVPMPTMLDKTMMQEGNTNEQEDNETKSVEKSSEQLLPEEEKPSVEDMLLWNPMKVFWFGDIAPYPALCGSGGNDGGGSGGSDGGGGSGGSSGGGGGSRWWLGMKPNLQPEAVPKNKQHSNVFSFLHFLNNHINFINAIYTTLTRLFLTKEFHKSVLETPKLQYKLLEYHSYHVHSFIDGNLFYRRRTKQLYITPIWEEANVSADAAARHGTTSVTTWEEYI
ncbi:hypothetical protein IFM89_026063 [Coptis chinensis]|uniref:Uncharacterized protein n=1 Tax=Coptis chinensis TaxID=261450 RepID=A0A835IDP5_9MAGN|nr:hypothetical protein IFM89_026063 [Coptis chinensis]